MDAEFHNAVLEKSCPQCKAMRGSECRTYNDRLVSPPHQRRWAKLAEARYKAYAKANRSKDSR